MPVGGKLVLKGGIRVTSSGVEKKKKKKRRRKDNLAEDSTQANRADQGISASVPPLQPFVFDATSSDGAVTGSISVQSNKTYEEEFAFEIEKVKHKRAPEILHGYDKKITGKNAAERLDMRSSMKADRYCK